jgi:hypothetical protein
MTVFPPFPEVRLRVLDSGSRPFAEVRPETAARDAPSTPFFPTGLAVDILTGIPRMTR